MKKPKLEKLNFHIYFRILGYAFRYWKLVILCFILCCIMSLLHFASMSMLSPISEMIFNPQQNKAILERVEQYGEWGIKASNFLKEQVFTDPMRALWILMVTALVCVAIKNITRFFQEYIAGYVTNKVLIDISEALYARVLRLRSSNFSQKGTSELTSRFTNDIPYMGAGIKIVLGKALREPLQAMACLLLAVLINWKLAIISCIIFPIIGGTLRKLGKKIKKGAKKTLSKRANIMGLLYESFNGIKIAKTYQMEDKLNEKFIEENKKLLKYQLRVILADSISHPLVETIIVAGGVLVLGFVGKLVLVDQSLSQGDLCLFVAALGSMVDPLRKLTDLNIDIANAIASGERVFELMDKEPEQMHAPNTIELPSVQNDICFNHVTFSYEPGKPVLKDISFQVNKGEKIALVGRSGAGKSTLISLLPRFFDPDSGEILIDGHKLQDISLYSLRSHIGLVTQEAFLFNDTIAKNISSGEESDTNRIIDSAKSAYADNFIQNLYKQYDTLYGPNGIDLSGGQKHRVSLARAIYKQPDILILDEAMANLDAESEAYILESLEEFTKDRTTFIIAHRFSTIESVDRILVLEDGNLIGFGPHKELIKTNALYRNLYERQNHSELLV